MSLQKETDFNNHEEVWDEDVSLNYSNADEKLDLEYSIKENRYFF